MVLTYLFTELKTTSPKFAFGTWHSVRSSRDTRNIEGIGVSGIIKSFKTAGMHVWRSANGTWHLKYWPLTWAAIQDVRCS